MMWYTLVVGLLFVAISIVIALDDPSKVPQSLATGSFFGLCAAIAIVMIVRERAERASLRRPADVEVAGGVTLQVRRGPLWWMSIALIVVGGLGVYGGWAISPIYAFLSGFIAIVGIGLAGLLVRGLDAPALRFEPEGLWLIQRRFRYCILWDDLEVGGGRTNDHFTVSVFLNDEARVLDSVEALRGEPVEPFREGLARQFRRSRAWSGADLMWMPWQYGVDPVRFVQALIRYAAEPAHRQELCSPPQIEG
ncbi:MAG: hypothetical protein AAGA48_31505 [Myxococcota bacterium]